jgi:hypothetical protein
MRTTHDQSQQVHEHKIIKLDKRVKKLELKLKPQAQPSWPPKVSTALPL